MPAIFRRIVASRVSGVESVRSLRMLALVIVTAPSISGCDGAGAAVSVTGEVRLDGVCTPAEIQIEQVNADGNRVGRSVTAYADNLGQYAASIEPANGAAGALDCRLVVRVSRLSRNGLSAAFDESAPPTKSIRLKRSIRDNDSLDILLTQ
ncbi:MAG: hypothetical protein ACKVHE_04775 [Planctomycetales bacterium]|jgi:hypothetical protein